MDNKMKLNVMMELKNKGFEKSDIIAMVNDGKVFNKGMVEYIDGLIAMDMFDKSEIANMVINSKPEEAEAEAVADVPKKGKKGKGKPSKYNWIKDFDQAEYEKMAIKMNVAIMEGDKFIKVGAKNREKVYRACGFIK